MADNGRLNKVIDLLEHGHAVFSCGTIPNGNFEEIAALGQSAYDMIILETEHVGFDFPTLRHSLQYLLNRKRIVDKGNLQLDVVPLVRIPPYTRERNAWVIKQTLDAGPFGLVLPHLDSVEGAQAAVRAARYPQVPGATDSSLRANAAGRPRWRRPTGDSHRRTTARPRTSGPSTRTGSCCSWALSKTCVVSTPCRTSCARSKASALSARAAGSAASLIRAGRRHGAGRALRRRRLSRRPRAAETRTGIIASFDDYWSPIEAGTGQMPQAYPALPESTRWAVRRRCMRASHHSSPMGGW